MQDEFDVNRYIADTAKNVRADMERMCAEAGLTPEQTKEMIEMSLESVRIYAG